jgi:hypothetical protein
MNAPSASRLYDAFYFAHSCGRPYQRDEIWLNFFDHIAERIITDIRPATVLDAGCALGFLVERLRQHGVEAFGVDVSAHAIENAHESIRPYCWIGSIATPFPQRYDLIVCIEVLEHLPPRDTEQTIANFCQHTDDVLFSSTPFDYKEVTHFNVQAPEHWAEWFARYGFFRDVDFDASFITPWAVRFRRRAEPTPRLVHNYERRFWLLWKENTDLRSLTLEMRQQLVELERAPQDAQAAQQQAIATHAQTITALQQAIRERDQTIQRLSAQLVDMKHSQGWQLILWLGRMRLRIAPHGSRREKLFLKIIGK